MNEKKAGNEDHIPSALSRRRFLALSAASAGALAVGTYGMGLAAGAVKAPEKAPSSAAWEKIINAANKEANLNILSVLNTAHDNTTAAGFTSNYPGINVTFSTLTPAELEAKVNAEHAAHIGTVDVVFNIDRLWHAQSLAQGYFKTIIGPDVVAADALVRHGAPPSTTNVPVASQALYYNDTLLTTLIAPWGYGWNKDVIHGKPSFESLFQTDKYKGRFGMLDPNQGANTVTLLSLLKKRYPDLWTRLGQLNPTFFETAGPLVQAMAAGAVDVALTTTAGATDPYPNLGFAFDSKHKALATTLYAEVMATAPNPNAAQLFVDWVMTKTGQSYWCSGYDSVLPNISTTTGSAIDTVFFEAYPAAEAAKDLAQLNAILHR
jgi:iron(III) transport system substrate-binding protein